MPDRTILARPGHPWPCAALRDGQESNRFGRVTPTRPPATARSGVEPPTSGALRTGDRAHGLPRRGPRPAAETGRVSSWRSGQLPALLAASRGPLPAPGIPVRPICSAARSAGRSRSSPWRLVEPPGAAIERPRTALSPSETSCMALSGRDQITTLYARPLQVDTNCPHQALPCTRSHAKRTPRRPLDAF